MEKQILATVGNTEITREELDNIIKHAPNQQKVQFNSFAGRQYLLNEMVTQQLLYLDAKDKGLEKEEAFQKELQALKENLLKQYAIKKLIKDLDVTDEEMQEFYKENEKQFRKPESIRAKHILVKEEKEAKNILKELQDGKLFEDAAQQYSVCPSKGNGGDLGYFTKGKMVPEFEEACEKLEIGEMSDLVKTHFGYHIIKIVDKKPACVAPLAEVQEQIKVQLLGNKQSEKYKNYTDGLRDNYEVTTHEELLKEDLVK